MPEKVVQYGEFHSQRGRHQIADGWQRARQYDERGCL